MSRQAGERQLEAAAAPGPRQSLSRYGSDGQWAAPMRNGGTVSVRTPRNSLPPPFHLSANRCPEQHCAVPTGAGAFEYGRRRSHHTRLRLGRHRRRSDRGVGRHVRWWSHPRTGRAGVGATTDPDVPGDHGARGRLLPAFASPGPPDSRSALGAVRRGTRHHPGPVHGIGATRPRHRTSAQGPDAGHGNGNGWFGRRDRWHPRKRSVLGGVPDRYRLHCVLRRAKSAP